MLNYLKRTANTKDKTLLMRRLLICLKLKKKNLTNLLEEIDYKDAEDFTVKLRQLRGLILVRKNQLVR